MTVIGLFLAQVAIYAIVPFYLAALKRPLRVAGFYIYLGLLLLLGSLMGSIYSLPVLPSLYISGGNLAYGALLMSAVLLVIIERDVGSLRRVILVVVVVSIFVGFLYILLGLMLNHETVVRPFAADSGIFALSLLLSILGAAMIVIELVILLVIFEQINRRVSNITVVSCLYTLCFVGILCLDGLLFPIIASVFNPQLVATVIGGVSSKLVMGVTYSVPMLIFLLVYRHTLTEFLGQPLTLIEMLNAGPERLVEVIQQQRKSLALGEEQLHVFAQRLALATESAGLGIWDLDLETNQLVWDERNYELYGLATDAMAPTVALWEERVHPDDLPALQIAYADALAGTADYHTQFRVLLPDGQLRYLESYATVQRRDDGTPRRMIGVNWDITQRKNLEIENEQLTEQFYQAQRLESIGRLAGGIAHDFNNLLVPISSYAELGQRKTSAGESTHTYFGRIKDAADRAAALTRQILAFSRKQNMEMKAVDLNQTVEGFQSMIQRFIGENIELSLELSPSLLPIMADAGQIEQVLMNLVVNARDAMPNGGNLTVATSKEYISAEYAANHDEMRPGLYMVLTVRDNGIGMDETTKQRVFEPFFTTKPQGQGTGLGLATVFGIVKQHQGAIEIYTKVGHGTTFKVSLPTSQE